MTEVPKHFPVTTAGDLVKLSLRGVVGFGEIILKLVTTLDAELSRTTEAEAVLAQRWTKLHGPRYSLPAGVRPQETRIEKLIRKLGLESPIDPIALLPMLRRRNLVAAI